MRVLVNSWSDEARAASLEVRRSKRQERGRAEMIERKRKEFFAANPGATEADWKAHDAKQLKEWQAKRDRDRWLKENPGNTEADWQDRDKARVAAWKKSKEDEEKALLEKHKARFDRQATGPRKRDEFFVENWIPRDDDGLGFPSVIDAETGEAIELPPDMLEPEYDPRTGEFYRPPAVLKDPHWGPHGPDAPYGYHDATGEPRKEPLYDLHGRPIMPRLPASAFRKRQDYEASSRDWLERSEKALKEWGRWGKGKRGRD